VHPRQAAICSLNALHAIATVLHARPRSSVGYATPSNSPEKKQVSPGCGHAVDTASAGMNFPADLQTIIAAWPTLPEPIKAGILAIVNAAGGKDA
jgi:hypothetical protein